MGLVIPTSRPTHELGAHTYVVHIATLHCGGFLRWLIFVDTHLYKGFCGFGASGWKEQAG